MTKPRVAILVGTKKGLYVYRAGPSRTRWVAEGPHFAPFPIYHAAFDPRDGASVYAAVNATFGGPRIEVSRDLGRTWTTAANPAFPQGSNLTFARAWHIEPGHASQPNVVWAGVEPAALFRSDDRGMSWQSVRALNEHAERPHWSPGGGGLGLHSIGVDAADPDWITIGISSAGVYDTRDGGQSWTNGNAGTRSPFPDGDGPLMRCVHHLVAHPARSGVRFQQNHFGVYRREGSASKWTARSAGLPSDFGFASGIHPRDDATSYVIPLHDRMRAALPPGIAVYRTRDGGATWKRLAAGLPRGAQLEVMREGMATDRADPAGVYFGTTNGEVWASADEGRAFTQVAAYLPAVLSVSTITT